MTLGIILMAAMGGAALALGLFGCFLVSSDEQQRRRDDQEIRRQLHTRWDA